MTYKEFKHAYKGTLKHYPAMDRFFDSFDEAIGTVETIRYEKTGTRWTEIKRETEPMTGRYFLNCVDAVPLFRNLGGIERVEMAHTRIGYLPATISSTSPDRGTKVVRIFNLD